MKIALAQINPTVGALRSNSARIADFARRAEARGAGLVLFPEMAICGYPPRDLVEKPEFVAESQAWLQEASRAVPGVVIVAGCVTPAAASTGKSVHNSALVLQGGEVLFQQSKMLLPTYDVFDELRNFAPADQQKVWRFAVPGGGGQRVALTICEDAWNDKNYWPKRQGRLLYERDPVAEQLRAGADFLINMSASPYSAGKIALRQEMLGAIAREYRIPVLFVNQVGGNDQLIFDGSSMALGEDGTLRARGAQFEEDLIVVDSEGWRGEVRPAESDATAVMHEALVLGTRDYVRKCGVRRVVVGLSGGIDSAVTAAIAVEALGREHVEVWYMPSRFSSDESAQAAQAVARNLGLELREHSIEPEYEAALRGLEAELAQAGAGARLARQNLQSRLRGLHLMAVSNLTGALVLTTGNKSEMAVGYCTLYGDMAGGLAVIADVLKTQVYDVARHLNRNGAVIPAAVMERAPTAELESNQRDEDDLPPYAVLDAVIAQYVEEYRGPEAIAQQLDVTPDLVRAMIQRIDRSEFKRQQAAPGLKVSKKAFGMGRRLPIAQGYEPTPAGERELSGVQNVSEKVAL